jgi:hypothetical protein
MNSFRFLFATCSLLFIQYSLIAQASTAEQNSFCSSLMNVLQIGKYDNFESIGYTRVKASPFLEVPVAPAKMLRFPVVYVDKDSRFVGKSNITYDSLSALRELEVLKDFVGVCLDTAQWQKWNTELNDDPSTVFFTEYPPRGGSFCRFFTHFGYGESRQQNLQHPSFYPQEQRIDLSSTVYLFSLKFQ